MTQMRFTNETLKKEKSGTWIIKVARDPRIDL